MATEFIKLRNEIEATLDSPALLADRDWFHFLVARAMTLLDLDDDIAGKLPVSRSAVARWRQGTSAPLPAMRKPIYKLLLRRTIAKIEKDG